MIPDYLVDQPLEILKAKGYSFSDMSDKQKETAKWWFDHYENSKSLPLQDFMESRMKLQGYVQKPRTFIGGKQLVWTKP